MKNFDYIIAGGGCAGLSLAYYLSQSKLAGKRILVIDRSAKNANDRTWCFWTQEPSPFQSIVYREWPTLSFRQETASYRSDLGNSRYQMIRGLDFYRHVRRHLATHDTFHFLQAEIQLIGEDPHGPFVRAGGQIYRAEWIFDSTLDQHSLPSRLAGHNFLWQHFHGWIVETSTRVFRSEDATLMDFRTPQRGRARFFYVLPLDERRALVEYTIFSPNLLRPEDYRRELDQYCRNHLGLQDYRVLEREQGKIPMTDAPLVSSKGHRIVAIGTTGGAVKPSTGYAFLRIQQQVRRIVDQLEKGQTPAQPAPPSGRFHFYDRLLLHILQHEGKHAKEIFCRLFRHHSMRRILTFLDERSNWRQEIRIFARLPFGPFLRALWSLYLKPHLKRERPAQQQTAGIAQTLPIKSSRP